MTVDDLALLALVTGGRAAPVREQVLASPATSATSACVTVMGASSRPAPA